MKREYFIISILCVIFISLNLRAPMSVIGPIVDNIMFEFNLNSTQIGILSSLPLFCFFVFSLIAPILPNSKAMLFGLVLIILGLFTRSFFNAYFLFLGSFLIGIGIAILNVLMPSFIKNNFKNISKIMAIYSMILALSSLIGLFGHYLISYINLSGTLFCWVIFSIIALFCYMPFVKNKRFYRKKSKKSLGNFLEIFKNKNAWIITIFMGLQSCVFYTTITWYPSVLAQFMSEDSATNIVILFQALALITAYFVPNFMYKFKNQNIFLSLICLCNVIGFLLCLFCSSLYLLILSAIFFSIPIGGIFGIVLTMIATKSKDTQTTIYLSSMAQSVGYLIATFGPIIFGFFKDHTHNFNISIVFMVIISFLMLIFAILSNKIQQI